MLRGPGGESFDRSMGSLVSLVAEAGGTVCRLCCREEEATGGRGYRKRSFGNGRLGRFVEENCDKRPWWMKILEVTGDGRSL